MSTVAPIVYRCSPNSVAECCAVRYIIALYTDAHVLSDQMSLKPQKARLKQVNDVLRIWETIKLCTVKLGVTVLVFIACDMSGSADIKYWGGGGEKQAKI